MNTTRISAVLLVLFLGLASPHRVRAQEITPENRAEAARLLTEGRSLIAKGRLFEAANRFQRARKLDPFEVMAPFHLAEVEYALGRRGGDPEWVGRAQEFLRQAERVNPEFGGLPFLLGTIGREVGDFETGIIGFAAAIERGYRLLDSRIGLAQCLLGRGLQAVRDPRAPPEEAVRLLTDARDRLAVLKEDSRFDDRALEAYREQWLESQIHLAAALHRAGKPEAAEKLLRELGEMEPGNAAFALNLGQLLSALERWDEALAACERARTAAGDPEWLDPLPVMATILSRQGKREEAEKLFHTYLRRYPGNPIALYGLGEHLARMEEFEGAIAAFEKCLEAEPFRLDLMATLSELHEKAGNPAEATKWRLLRETLEREASQGR